MDTKDEYSTSDVAMELAIAVSRLQARMKHEAGIAEQGITASQLAMLKRLDTEENCRYRLWPRTNTYRNRPSPSVLNY